MDVGPQDEAAISNVELGNASLMDLPIIGVDSPEVVVRTKDLEKDDGPMMGELCAQANDARVERRARVEGMARV